MSTDDDGLDLPPALDRIKPPTAAMASALQAENIARLIEKAAAALAKATTAAEVLDAHDKAAFAYDAAKATARFAEKKQAHDEIIAACRKAQGDALVIEAQAQCRLADEYDAAQERGEVQRHGGQGKRDVPIQNIPPTVDDIGLDRKQVHEARKVRDAEKREPGVVRNTVEAKLHEGKEPTRAEVKRAVDGVLEPPPRPTAQSEAAAKAVAPSETRICEAGSEGEAESEEPDSYLMRAYLIGHIRAAELLADIFEGRANVESERNTPESKIKAVAWAAAAAAARAVEENGYELMNEVDDETKATP
jgi:hypothetical protein